MKAGQVEVSFDLLADLLQFPPGTRVLRVSDADRPGSRTFTVVVEHDDLPDVQDVEGWEYPRVFYTVTKRTMEGTFSPF